MRCFDTVFYSFLNYWNRFSMLIFEAYIYFVFLGSRRDSDKDFIFYYFS